jgi:hypothetical protein
VTIEVLPDPIRGWLKNNPRPAGHQGWWPATDQQGSAMDCAADILLLGGSAGSLKTSTILADLIQERDYPRMNAYFFRKTYPELEEAMQQAYDLYPQTGGSYNSSSHTWTWPSGAHFRFRHLSHEKNLYENQGKAMSAIGIDESTHLPMDWIRYLFTRNRSTDPNFLIRMRLGTNPGNISTKEHQAVFFNKVCPHCEPRKAPPQGTLLFNRKWHDGVPMRDPDTGADISVAYILSSVRDHNLLGPGYVARLKMQRPAVAKALLAGCWRLFEGLYFDIWDPDRMVVPIQKIPQEWWQSWWVGADYGYSGSIAAAGLYTRPPDGIIYKVAEHPIGDPQYGLVNLPRENVRTFARNVYEAFAKKTKEQEQPRKVEAMYLGPDSWNDRGDEHTLAGQMNEELEPHGLEFTRANNDRAGGAQLVYTTLEQELFKVADTCRNTITMFESRLHDEKEPVKVQKIPTDPLDDVWDETRYGIYSYLEAEGKPQSLRIQERMKKIIESGGKTDMALTSAWAQQTRIKAQEDADEESPVYVGANARRRMRNRKS